MNVLTPRLQHYLRGNAPALMNATVDYAALFGSEFASIDIYDHREHINTIAPTAFAHSTLCRARALMDRGIVPGDRVVLLAVNSEYYLTTVLAVLAIGAVPCAVSPPVHVTQPDSAGVHHVRSAIDVVDPKLVVIQPRYGTVFAHPNTITFDELASTDPLSPADLPRAQPGDTHHIQLTSGSTSAPKAVVLSHQNVAHNIAAICQATNAIRGVDRAFSWLPLYHDMGFIQVLCALTHGIPLAIMSPLSFLRDPLSWLRHMTTHHATQTAGPPFAFRATADALLRTRKTGPVDGIELSGLRCAYVGAEPISHSTLHYFTDSFRNYGLRDDVLVPCYGMAESVLATTLALAPSETGPSNFGRVRLTEHADTGLAHVSCGKALDSIEIRITDAAGTELPAGEIGDIHLRGPSIMLGYLTTGGKAIPPGSGWHRTGDRGFLDDGELFVIGRSKELVIVRGRNFPPYDVEKIIDDVDSIGPGRSLVFSIPDEGRGSEGVAAVVGVDVNPNGLDPNELDRVRREISTAVRAAFGFSLDQIALIPTELIPRTTSGKLQRVKARELYLRGNFADFLPTR